MKLNIDEALQSMKQSIEELQSIDKQYLSVLFKCRDDILKCLSITESIRKKSKGTIEKLDDLEDYLNDERSGLLQAFLDKFCLHSLTDDELKKGFLDNIEDDSDLLSGIDQDDIPSTDAFVYRYIGEKIFNSLKKENTNMLYDSNNDLFDLWGDDGSDIIEAFIPEILSPKLDSFLESPEILDQLQDEICKEKNIEPTQEIYDFFHGGLDFVKKEFLKSERNHALSVYNDMMEDDMGQHAFSMENGGKSYTLLFLFVLNKKHIYSTLKSLISSQLDYFVNKKGYEEFEGKMSFGLSLSIDQMINSGSGLSDSDFVSSQVKQLIITSFDKDLLLGIDNIDVSFNDLNSGLTTFGSAMANALMKLSNNSDMKILSKDYDDEGNPLEDRDGSNMEIVYKRHKVEMNRYIVNRILSKVQEIVNKEFSNLNEWTEDKKDSIIQSLYDKYPNASKNLRFKLQGKSKGKERREKFLSNYISKIKKDINNYFRENQEELLKLKLVDFNVMACFYVISVSKIIKHISLDEEFEKFVISELEQTFSDSHRINTERTRRESEKNQANESIDDEIDQVISHIKDIIAQSLYKTPPISNNNLIIGGHSLGADKETNGIAKLPGELLSELSEYFGGSIDYLLKKYLTKIYNKRGFYKKQWFEKYNIKQEETEFFDILKKHGFTCEDDIIQEKDVSEISKTGNEQPENNEPSPSKETDENNNSELTKLFDEAILLESLDEKMEKFFDILTQLGYTFDSREKMKSLLVDKCTSNKVLATGFESIMKNLINGVQVEEKKQKKWNGNPVYGIAMGNTGYRLLIQDLGDQKCIFNLMSHNDYITFLTKNCK